VGRIAEYLGEWAAVQFDMAVLEVGLEVEAALAKNAGKSKGKRKSVAAVLVQVLGPGPDSGRRYANLSNRPGVKVVKAKPGEDPLTALLRAEKEEGHGG